MFLEARILVEKKMLKQITEEPDSYIGKGLMHPKTPYQAYLSVIMTAQKALSREMFRNISDSLHSNFLSRMILHWKIGAEDIYGKLYLEMENLRPANRKIESIIENFERKW